MAVPGNVVDPFAQSNPQEDVEFQVDLTDIQSNFRIPKGEYEAVCFDVERSISDAGNPMIIWSFRLTKGEFAGREWKNFTALTPQAMWKVAETVESLGLGATGSVSRFKAEDALGRLCVLAMIDDEYKGQKRSAIGSVMPHPDGVGTKMKAAGQP